MKSKIDKIKEKLAKLIRKQQSAEEIGSLAEAELFATKINDLLKEYNLALSDIDTDSDEYTPKGTIIDVRGISHRNEGSWVYSMFNTISYYNQCKTIKLDDGTLDLIGLELNVETVEYISMQLIVRIRHLGKKEYKETGKLLQKNRNAYLRGYYMGAVAGINHKLDQQKQRQEEVYTSKDEEGLIRIGDAVDRFFEEKYPSTRKSRPKRLSKGSFGASAGYETGKNIDIHKGVDSSRSSRLLS